MRIVRNLLVLGLLAAAPLVAQSSLVIPPSQCGSCVCDPGQCCKMSWAGGCECLSCNPDP